MSDKQMSNNQHCWLAEDDNRYTLYRTISQNTFWDLFDIIQGYLFNSLERRVRIPWSGARFPNWGIFVDFEV